MFCLRWFLNIQCKCVSAIKMNVCVCYVRVELELGQSVSTFFVIFLWLLFRLSNIYQNHFRLTLNTSNRRTNEKIKIKKLHRKMLKYYRSQLRLLKYFFFALEWIANLYFCWYLLLFFHWLFLALLRFRALC